MNKSISISDSLIGSLCREVEYIRLRYKNVSNSLENCKDKLLRKRLLEEILNLEARRFELIDISDKFIINSTLSISKIFFHDLCHRPLEYI